jgi:hypothetical protein
MALMVMKDNVEIPEGKHLFQVLDGTGDTTLAYDPLIDADLKELSDKFEECLSKGMFATVMDEHGAGTVTRDFEEVKAAPRTILSPQIVGG